MALDDFSGGSDDSDESSEDDSSSGLESLVKDIKALDDEEIEDFTNRFQLLREVVVAQHSEMEYIVDEIDGFDDEINELRTEIDHLKELLQILIDEYEKLNDGVQTGEWGGENDDGDDNDDKEYSWEQ